jgi:hypothetical protein
MSSQFIRVKFYQNGEYFPIMSEGSRSEMEILDEYLQDIFNGTNNMRTGLPNNQWYEVDTLDDEDDILVYLVKENPTPKNSSMIESMVRIDFPSAATQKWAGTQHRMDLRRLPHNPFSGTINLVFQFEGGAAIDPVNTSAVERKMKEDALKAMEDDLRTTETNLKILRANIEKTKAELSMAI